MSRPSSGGFIFGFAAEIAIVVAIVSLLPKVDLSGGRSVPAADTPPTLVSPARETSYYERRSGSGGFTDLTPERESGASLPPRFREPPPLIAVDPARPAYVERRLDQASQNLVNGLGSYVARSAERLVQPPDYRPQPQPYRPPASSSAAAAAPFTAGSFATQPAPTTQPRPWMRY